MIDFSIASRFQITSIFSTGYFILPMG